MKKMKKALTLSLALVMAASLFGCAPNGKDPAKSSASSTPPAGSQAAQSEGGTPAHDEIVIKLGASSAPTEPTGIAGQKFADLVNEKLAGQVKIEYYPGEQLGAAMEEVENMQVDLQQGAIFSFDNYSSIAKDLNIMSMAFAFDSIEHVYAFLGSDLADNAFQTLEDNGIHIVSYKLQKNPRAIFGKKPLETASDLAGVKFRIPNIDIWEKNFTTLGAKPTIVAWSDYTMAMMQGVIDAGECSYESIKALDLHKYAPYISLVDYAYPLESIAINMTTWEKLTPEEQTVINECADEVAQWFTDYVKEQWEIDKQTIIDEGGQFVEFDKQTFIDAMAPLAPQLETEGYWATPGLYDAVQALEH